MISIEISSEPVISLKFSFLLRIIFREIHGMGLIYDKKNGEEMSSLIENYDTPAPCNDLQKTFPAEVRIGCSPRTVVQLSVVLR